MISRTQLNSLIISGILVLCTWIAALHPLAVSQKNLGPEFRCGTSLMFAITGKDTASCMSDDPILIDLVFQQQLLDNQLSNTLEPPFTISSEVKLCQNWSRSFKYQKPLNYFKSVVRLKASVLRELSISEIEMICKNNNNWLTRFTVGVKFGQGNNEDIEIIRKQPFNRKIYALSPNAIFDPWPIQSFLVGQSLSRACWEPVTLTWNSTSLEFNCRMAGQPSPVKFLKCKDLQNCRPYVESMFQGKCMGVYLPPPGCNEDSLKSCLSVTESIDSNGILYCQDRAPVGHAVHVPIFKYTDASNHIMWHVFTSHDNSLERFVRLEFDNESLTAIDSSNTMSFTCTVPKFLATKGFTWAAVFENNSAILNCDSNPAYSDNVNLVEVCITSKPATCKNAKCKFQIICSVLFQNGKFYQATANYSFSGPKSQRIRFPEDESAVVKKEVQNNNNSNSSSIDPELIKSVDTIIQLQLSNRSTFPNKTQSQDVAIKNNSQNTSVPAKTTLSRSDWRDWPHWHLILAAGMAVVILVLGILLVRYYCKSKQRKRDLVSAEEIRNFLGGAVQMGKINIGKDQNAMVVPYDMKLEVPRGNIKLEANILGRGNFGKVVEGFVGTKSVAIKMLDKTVDAKYFRAMLSELKIMSYVGKHENIVELVGANTEKIRNQDIYVILEFCHNGNARDYVRARRDVFLDLITGSAINPENYTPADEDTVEYENVVSKKLCSTDLIRWSMEIAAGMDFVASKNVYHGDLAARNILLSNRLVAKIGDFGLAKQLTDYSLYVQKKECPLPLKWMSIESLRDLEFSIQSDVWSFGVTVWELFSLGSVPYPGVEWNFQSWKDLLEGNRMDRALYASPQIHEILLKCWETQPEDRPRFAELQKMFATELHKINWGCV